MANTKYARKGTPAVDNRPVEVKAWFQAQGEQSITADGFLLDADGHYVYVDRDIDDGY